MKIELNKFITILLSFLVIHSILLQIGTPYIISYYNLRFKILFVLFVCLIPYSGILFKKKYLRFNLIIIIVAGSYLISALVNKNVYVLFTSSSFTVVSQIILFAWYCEFLDARRQTLYGLKVILSIVVLYCILSDILMIIDPHYSVSEWGEVSYNYLVGSKFNLCYLHFLSVILYCTLYNDRKKRCLIILWCGIIAIFSSCSTMVIGTILYSMFMFFSKKIRALFEKRLFVLIYLTICSVVLLVGSSLLKIPIIQYFIVDVLHESLTLTGRMDIYQKIGSILLLDPIWGGGYDANYYLSMKMTGAADIQNGILDIMISVGIFGVIMFGILLCSGVKSSRLIKSPSMIMGVYTYITLSSVEVTFRISFYCLLILIILCSWSSDKTLKDNHYLKGRNK